MRISRGTKSLLFGAHQFIIHPLLVYYCYCKLYGFTLSPAVILSCIVHDWGYFGKPDMDGPQGKMHPLFGAGIMFSLLGSRAYLFCLLHSREMSKIIGELPSKLCVADKYAIYYTPLWMYCKDELDEYVQMSSFNSSDVKHWKSQLDNRVLDFIKRKDDDTAVYDYLRN